MLNELRVTLAVVIHLGDSCGGKMIMQSSIKQFRRTNVFCSGSIPMPDAGGCDLLSLYPDGLKKPSMKDELASRKFYVVRIVHSCCY